MTKRPNIIVVGMGVSGQMAALKAVECGAEVMLFADAQAGAAPSSTQRNGINAVLNTAGEGDAPALHAADTIRCGDFLAHEGPVRAMCAAAPMIVSLLDRMGVAFDRTSEGLTALARLSGSSKRRSAIAGARTGHHVQRVLYAQVLRQAAAERVRRFEGWEFLSLILDEGGACRGIVAADRRNMEIRAFAANAVVICAGGYGGLFGRTATRPASDGAAIGICYEQGAAFANPEFVQIVAHAIPGARRRHEIGDPVLAAGARVQTLRDGHPWYVLEEWFPAARGMVPGDIAARAIQKMREETGRRERGAIRLDLSALDPGWALKHFADAADLSGRISGDDPWEKPMEIVPAVGLSLGGLMIDAGHASTIRGLFAAGGAAALYHGACALPGNELLADVYGGLVAGEGAVRFVATAPYGHEASSALLDAAKAREEDDHARLAQQEGGENAHILREEAAAALEAAAFIVRDRPSLAAAGEKIREIEERFDHAPLLDRSEWANDELLVMRRVRRGLRLAGLIVAAAAAREESRGAHFKPSVPGRNDAQWRVTTKALWAEAGHRLDHSEKIESAEIIPDERKY